MNKEQGTILIIFSYEKIVASLFEIDEDKETAFEGKRKFTIRFTDKDNRVITLIKENEAKESALEIAMNEIITTENNLKMCGLNELKDDLDKEDRNKEDHNKTCFKDVESDFIKIKYYKNSENNGLVLSKDLIGEEDLIIKNGECFRIVTINKQDVENLHLYCSIDNPRFPMEILRKKSNKDQMTKIASVKADQVREVINFTYL